MMTRSLLSAGALCAVLLSPGVLFAAEAAKTPHDHSTEITEYLGTKTCVECHEEAAKEVVASLHYQHQAEAPLLQNWEKGKLAGMMVSF